MSERPVPRSRTIGLTSTFAGLLLLAACGGSDGEPRVADQPRDTRPDVTEPDEPPASTIAPSTGTLDDVRAATVQIVAKGSFIDPEFGMVEGAGSGSGFIIDGSGIAVTNNHVVTGSASLNVYLDGEDEPRNARVLGVSECSDLAVIDIDGDDYPTLQWHDGEVSPGLDIFAAGFPLGDPEYTLTKGIVAKAEADGDHNWTSVDHTIEHDANIQPGNSGGPLVTADGSVVGVNYAGGAMVTTTAQFFAISAGEAQDVVAQLREGSDVTSIGVNGMAFADPDSGLSGVWVSGVESGSPADQAGIRGGDILMRMEGLTLGTDGTMSDYCDILRSRNATDTLRVEVLRFATGEILEGELNGRELEVVQVLDTPDPVEEPAEPTDDPAEPATTTVTLADDTGSFTIDVPSSWADVSTSPQDLNGMSVGAVMASTDITALSNTFDVPGVLVVASPELGSDMQVLADALAPEGACTADGSSPFDGDGYSGVVASYSDCGDSGAGLLVLAMTDGFTTVAAVGQFVTAGDYQAVQTALGSITTL